MWTVAILVPSIGKKHVSNFDTYVLYFLIDCQCRSLCTISEALPLGFIDVKSLNIDASYLQHFVEQWQAVIWPKGCKKVIHAFSNTHWMVHPDWFQHDIKEGSSQGPPWWRNMSLLMLSSVWGIWWYSTWKVSYTLPTDQTIHSNVSNSFVFHIKTQNTIVSN